MITGFENITYPLTTEELRLVEIIVKGLKTIGPENPIKEPEICKRINEKKDQYGLSKKLTGARLRKIINHIRTYSLLPVIATSRGYYVSFDVHEIRQQKKSMKERAMRILSAAKGLERFEESPLQQSLF